MHSPIAATPLLEPIPRRPIHPKAAARFPAAFRALFRFPIRTVRKPQEVVILVTIEACLMVDTDDRQWGTMPSGWTLGRMVAAAGLATCTSSALSLQVGNKVDLGSKRGRSS
jgi:hypothetical protein